MRRPPLLPPRTLVDAMHVPQPPSPGPPLTPSGAVERGAKRVRVHVLTDGRDVPDGSSAQFVQQLQDDLAALKDK